ncbi:putative Hpr(Ser) kinase/phosphatase [Gammaproteobacteria bacterium]
MASASRRRCVTQCTGQTFVIRIAGRSLTVCGDASLSAVQPAFSGVIVPNEPGISPAPTLKISTHPDPAAQPEWAALSIGSHRIPDGSLAVIRRAPSSVEQFAPGPNPALLLDASPAALAGGDLRAQPAHHALAAWLSGPTLQVVHAGAVAMEGRGVLFIGVGGRGKTTTALACTQAGFAFLGDDLCVVEAGNPAQDTPARVYGVYATAKVNADTRERLQMTDWPSLGITPRQKLVIALPLHMKFQRSARLVAIVAVRAGDESIPQPRRVSQRAAIELLASTALPIASGSGTPAHWLSTAAALVREVPTFELGLNWDLKHVTSAILTLVLPPANTR